MGKWHNRWDVGYRKEKIIPDDEQFKRMKGFFKIKEDREAFLKTLEDAEARSKELYAVVEKEHPKTKAVHYVAAPVHHVAPVHHATVVHEPVATHVTT